jgi:hypothetical protein
MTYLRNFFFPPTIFSSMLTKNSSQWKRKNDLASSKVLLFLKGDLGAFSVC